MAELRASGGWLLFDDTGESVGPSTTPLQFSALRLSALGGLSMGAHKSVWKADGQRVWGQVFHVTLEFVGPRLSIVELFMPRPTDGKDWSRWTLENELARKAADEAWVAGVFGAPMELAPFEIDGKCYHPPDEPESARRALFAWGEVGSYYDSKGGMAFMRITYR